MLELILRAFDYIVKFIPRLVSPIKVEVQQFYCQLLGGDVYQSVTILTAWQKRYRAELLLINRKDLMVFVRDMLLVIEKEKTYKPVDEVTKIRLEPHQALKIVITFGIPDKDTPLQEGNYELTVIPTSGRKTVLKGCFPVDRT